MMKRHFAIAVAMFALLYVVGCGASDPTQVPATAVPASPRPTSIPPTATAAPTDTLAPPTATALPSPTVTSVPATAEPTLAPSATPLALPRFEPGICRFRDAYEYDMECGYLVVPEDRSNPQGPTVKMHVAIIKSRSTNPKPDPVIYVAGGGGHNHLDGYIRYMTSGGMDIRTERDYIMYNQRGARYGEPLLECPGVTELYWSFHRQNLSQDERDAREIEFFMDCYETLRDKGISLENYDTATNAADLNDLRIALGYEQVNLYGTSYGTRLILDAIRDYPEGIRSAIIDSVYPPQINYYGQFPGNAVRAFEAIFEDCAADPECSAQYPNLEDAFYQAVDELNANPVTMTFSYADRTMVVTGKTFIDAVYLLFYIVDEIANIPLYIYQASQGDYDGLAWLYPHLPESDSIAWGVFISFQCREEVSFEDPEESLALREGLPPQILEWYAWPQVPVTLCETWDTGIADAVENEPVVSNVPTLVFAGRYDPITPPAWGALAAETLSNSYFYEFPANGHGVMRDNRCALDIGLQFINDPATEPDASCLAEERPPDFE